LKKISGGITAPKGYKATGKHIGLKKLKPDLALLVSQVPAQGAGMFTTNLVQAAPVQVTKEHLEQKGSIRAVVVNSANANACTGMRGIADAREMTAQVAKEIGCRPEEVLVASTGVIGVDLPMEKLQVGIKSIIPLLKEDGGGEAAEAILTTDTFSKEYALEFELDGKTVRMGGMTKGSGMIHPNMATMLAFITTDAAISRPLLEKALREATAQSFNMISVDRDTSTNDMVVVMANGLAGNSEIQAENEDYQVFCQALFEVTQQLAKMIAKDGEGATKLVEIEVRGAQSQDVARTVARSIASSNLVKSAIFGEDANWGRILCAAGYSGATFEVEKVEIFLGDLKVAEKGRGIDFSEERAKAILGQEEVKISVDLNSGSFQATAWTCDLTFDYIKINASYRS
jgi:glutamate N-acetyltransferase/amino-acid N-acetyltransferase